MVILQSHRTQNMILRCYPNVSAILWRHQILSPVLFQQSLYFPILIHRILNLLVPALFYILCSIRREHSSRSFAPPKKWLLVWSRGVSSACAGVEYSTCIFFVVLRTVGPTCSKKTDCLHFLCLLPMVVMTRGLGTGATFMCGSY